MNVDVYKGGAGGDAHDQLAAMRSGAATSAGLVDRALSRIGEGDGQLRAFAVVLADRAHADAARADELRADGKDLPLLGVPVAVKADLAVAGVRHYLRPDGAPAAADCPEVAALRAAGAVVLGHSAMSEAALWATTTSRLHGATANPLDGALSSGGSSGGSAAAVAAGWAAAAVGTDMGGSVRIPAACCGLVGLKPQHGRRPAGPADGRWHGLREPGPITTSVRDCALLHWVLGGPLPSSPDRPRHAPDQLRVGVVGGPGDASGAAPAAAALLASLGHDVVPVPPPAARLPLLAAAPRYLRAAAEEVAELGPAAVLERRTVQAAAAGRLVPRYAAGLSARASAAAARHVRRLFRDVDVLLTPALGAPVPALAAWSSSGALRAGWGQLGLAEHTALWNVTGQPALVMPIRSAAPAGSSLPPPSVQLVGRPWGETAVLALAAALEQIDRARGPVASVPSPTPTKERP